MDTQGLHAFGKAGATLRFSWVIVGVADILPSSSAFHADGTGVE
jgi:hypothetical protein